jgi:hypothetical protein
MKISKKYANKETDFIEKASYEKEMEDLTNHQTNVRMATEMKEQLKQFKKGGTLPKYPHGGFIHDPTKPDGLGEGDFAIMNPPVPPTLASINPLDNPTVPQVSSLGTYNPVKLTVGERIGKAFSGLTSNPTTSGQTENREMSAYTPALIGQGISTAINAGILVKGYDKVAPVDNPYESQVINNMASRGIDTTQQRNQILSAYNAAKEGLSNARSANVQQALGTNLMNVTQSNLADSKLNEQQLNNQYKADFAQTLGSLGQQKASAQVYSEDMTARNKGTWQSELSKLGTSVADSAKFFTEKNLNTINNDMLLSILNQKYSNVGIDKSFSERLSKGLSTPEDFLVLKQAVGEQSANNIIKKFGE